MSRFAFLMLDGVGAGALPDAAAYGDAGSDTLGNLSRVVDLRLPFLEKLGLGNIIPIRGVPPVAEPLALPGRLATISAGKDTTVGHWEHMGVVTARPFPTYPEGFPEEVLAPFRARIGRDILGNKPASGTVILDELGAEHLATGRPIVYTSADGVFQIAAHVGIVPLEQLYEWCRIAREILTGPHAVARVIARPFTGEPGAFSRTKDRHDFSLEPPTATYLDLLKREGVPVLALGKVTDVFVARGITNSIKVASNAENLELVQALLERRGAGGHAGSAGGAAGAGAEVAAARRPDCARFDEGLLFTNLVDFDMVWGHRNDVDGFAAGLAALDAALPGIIAALDPGDTLLITADHGVDPTTVSTDHSREYVPLLLYPRPAACPAAVYEGTLADTGATLCASLTGGEAELGGDPVGQSRPARGWRAYTAVAACPEGRPKARPVPVRVAGATADEAAALLRPRLGAAPAAAVVLGSGLAAAMDLKRLASVPYREIPGWAEGSVSGHPYRLSLANQGGRTVALLEGRVHGYEGFDLSELQAPVRTLARWGVQKLLLTSSCGAVSAGLRPGYVVVGAEMLDLQTALLCDGPAVPRRVAATAPELVERVLSAAGRPGWLSAGVHVTVPGPQYETDAELAYLRALGGDAVSMSGAPELLAAREEGLEVAALSLIVNAGHTSHGGVLAGAEDAAAAFSAAVQAVLACWGY
jgi:phosphopentomutase